MIIKLLYKPFIVIIAVGSSSSVTPTDYISSPTDEAAPSVGCSSPCDCLESEHGFLGDLDREICIQVALIHRGKNFNHA